MLASQVWQSSAGWKYLMNLSLCWLGFSISAPLKKVQIYFYFSTWKLPVAEALPLPLPSYDEQRGCIITALPQQKKAEVCRDIQVTSAAGRRSSIAALNAEACKGQVDGRAGPCFWRNVLKAPTSCWLREKLSLSPSCAFGQGHLFCVESSEN